MPRPEQVLIFDADDTLWENNVIFERVIAEFLDWLAHPTLDKAELRQILDDIEAANAVTHGFGGAMFLRSLHDCFERLNGRPADDDERAEIQRQARALVDREVELIPEVAETLAELGTRHRLLLLTKGDRAEQESKLAASGLAHHFESLHIVAHKDQDTYRDLIGRLGLPTGRTWMIGNSPRSDILPARRAGLNAVFIPNDHTWVLEHDELDPQDEQVLRLDRFGQLRGHF